MRLSLRKLSDLPVTQRPAVSCSQDTDWEQDQKPDCAENSMVPRSAFELAQRKAEGVAIVGHGE